MRVSTLSYIPMLTDERLEGRLTRVEEDTLLPLALSSSGERRLAVLSAESSASRVVRETEAARAPKDGVTR